MLKLNQIYPALSTRLSLALIAVFGVLLLAMFASSASAQSTRAIGRGFTGQV